MKDRVSTLGKFSGLREKKDVVPAPAGGNCRGMWGQKRELWELQMRQRMFRKTPQATRGRVSWEQVGGGTAGKGNIESTVL